MYKEKMKSKIEIALSGILDLAWAGTALFLSFLIIYFFDKDADNQVLLLPEWSLFALFTLMNTLKKQETIVKHQENTDIKKNIVSNMFNLLNVTCVFLFIISLIAGRGYIELSSSQSSFIQDANIWIFTGSCLLYISACYQEHKYIITPHNT